MKYVKSLGLVLLAAVALMALAATASATIVTTTTGGAAATPTIHAVSSGGHIKLANPIANIECGATVEGKVESHGAGVTAKGNISMIGGSSCTNSWYAVTSTNGSAEIHYTSGHNGVLTSSGAKIKTTRLGIRCVYVTSSTSLGTITGGNPATVSLAASIPINTGESSGLCGTGSASLAGSFSTTSALYIGP